MADGLTQAELDQWLAGAAPAAPPDNSWMGQHLTGDDPESVRIRGIIRDIYARHGVALGTPLADAMDIIDANAAAAGASPHESGKFAWNNPQQRAQAREEYAAKGSTWGDRHRRWQESEYLLPKDAQEYLQNYGRDADFLESVGMSTVRNAGRMNNISGTETLALMGRGLSGVDATGMPSYDYAPPSESSYLRDFNKGEALRYWDASNNSPLYRKSWTTGTYKRTGGMGGAVVNATQNTSVPFGSAAEFLEAGVPARLRHGIRNPSEPAGDNARGEYRMRVENRPHLPVAILDIPSDATREEKMSRIGRLVKEHRQVTAPPIQDGVYAQTGWNMGDMLGSIAEGVASAADGTQALAPAIGFMLGGRGSVANVVKGALSDTATDFGTSSALSAGLNEQPERTWAQWAMPSFERPTHMISDEENRSGAATRAAQARQYEESGASGVSTADADAYSRLVKRSGDMIPQGPRYR